MFLGRPQLQAKEGPHSPGPLDSRVRCVRGRRAETIIRVNDRPHIEQFQQDEPGLAGNHRPAGGAPHMTQNGCARNDATIGLPSAPGSLVVAKPSWGDGVPTFL